MLSQQRKRNLMTKVKHDISCQTVCVFHVKLKTVRYTIKTESIEEEHAYGVERIFLHLKNITNGNFT